MRMRLLLSSFMSLSLPLFASDIKTDEHIQFVRGVAAINPEGIVQAQISAWVYEQEHRPGAKKAFAKIVGLDMSRFSDAERTYFESRTQLFRFDSERDKHVRLHVSITKEAMLPETDSDGLSRAQLILGPLSELTVRNEANATPVISFHAILPADDARQFAGQLIVVPETGLSIVSDIDDTIKDSNVLNRSELIKNTFLREFKPVAGMSERYAAFAEQDDKVRFHYLSSSPHQLYPALDAFLRDGNFPLGSVHLRTIDVSDEIFGNGDSSKQHKLSTLHDLLKQFPQRQFLLIGDSGEADPEIYAEIAHTYPQQIVGVYIRDVTNEAATAARYVKTFEGVAPTVWHIFTDPNTLSVPARSTPAKSDPAGSEPQ